ncbi:hypothetical protein [Pseudomonas baltica]
MVAPIAWRNWVTLANPDDPVDDASKPWPADRAVVTADTLVRCWHGGVGI